MIPVIQTKAKAQALENAIRGAIADKRMEDFDRLDAELRELERHTCDRCGCADMAGVGWVGSRLDTKYCRDCLAVEVRRHGQR